jgi:hypothetical protein
MRYPCDSGGLGTYVVTLKTSSLSYLNYLHSVIPVKMAVRMEV